ncbi:hypothetical protein [Sorangium sp. So ce204]|uniref:hypothetical protein n=1 Tax=Sorangium sp. So ce204 TaxID=3133288 RepID=UPI003F63E079
MPPWRPRDLQRQQAGLGHLGPEGRGRPDAAQGVTNVNVYVVVNVNVYVVVNVVVVVNDRS